MNVNVIETSTKRTITNYTIYFSWEGKEANQEDCFKIALNNAVEDGYIELDDIDKYHCERI